MLLSRKTSHVGPSHEGKEEKGNVRSDENVLAARENDSREITSARSGQKGLVVVIIDRVSPAFEATTSATPADVSSVQVTGDVGSQRWTGCAGAHQEEENKVTVAGPGLDGQGFAAVADAVAVVVPVQAWNDGMAKVKEMMGGLKAKKFALHGELIADKAAHSHALLDNVHPHQDMKKFLKEREEQFLLSGRGGRW